MGISVAKSSHKLEHIAVDEIYSEVNNLDASFVLFFASSRYELGRLSAYFQKKFVDAVVIGCTTSGEFIKGKLVKKSVVAMVFDKSVIESVKGELVRDLSDGIDLTDTFDSFEDFFNIKSDMMDIDKYIGIILVDGLRAKEEQLMDEIGNKTDISFIGGSAGDDLKFKETQVAIGDKAFTNAAVLTILKPKVPFTLLKTQSFEKLDKVLKATKVNEEVREVKEFNGNPATEEYAKLLGVPVEEASEHFFTNPVGLQVDENPKNIYVRSPQRCDGKSIIFYCNILEGMDVNILKSGNICDETKTDLENTLRNFGKATGIIDFHCILRTLELERVKDCDKYAEIFEDIPSIGFSTYGEEYIGHINQTSTMLIFGENQVLNKDNTESKIENEQEIKEIEEKIFDGDYIKGGNDMSKNFYMPKVNLMGVGCHKQLGDEIKKLCYKKAFIATTPGMLKRGTVDKIVNLLKEIDVEYIIWDGVIPNPNMGCVEDGLSKLNEDGNCDFILSIGGGSYHDVSKAIGILATNGGKIQDYEGANKLTENSFPHIAVNTTSGTASQITRFSVITDETRKVKMVIVDDRITPIVSVDDPELMMTMPPELTASTGMDALTHAVEAYVSTGATLLTDTLALKAIELIGKYLRRSVWNPDDLEARDMMTWAEHIAGMAFNNGLLGYVHSVAHQLGGVYDLPHGVCNALLLPHISEFNSKAVPEKFKEIAAALGEYVEGTSDSEGATICLEAIQTLSKDIKIPQSLKELGVKEEDIPTLAQNALLDVCALSNPRKANLEDIIRILQKAM